MLLLYFNILVETVIDFSFQVFLNGQFKIINLFEIKIFYNIVNIFTVTFDQFNMSLLSKSIIKNLTGPKLMNKTLLTNNIK